jgi:hypothetical protein
MHSSRNLAFACVLIGLFSSHGSLRASGSEQTSRAERAPGELFAEAAVAFARSGFRLAAIELAETGDTIGLGFLFSRDGHAEMLSLEFAEGGRGVRSFARTAALPPEETRVYRREKDLIEALAAGPVTALEFGCEEYLLMTARDGNPIYGVPVEPSDYYVVTESARGNEAAERAARAIADLGAAGMMLVGLERSDDQSAGLVFSTWERQVAVTFTTDRRHRVNGFELRESPARELYRRYPSAREKALLDAVSGAGSILAVRWKGPRYTDLEESAALVLELRGGARITIDPIAFVLAE